MIVKVHNSCQIHAQANAPADNLSTLHILFHLRISSLTALLAGCVATYEQIVNLRWFIVTQPIRTDFLGLVRWLSLLILYVLRTWIHVNGQLPRLWCLETHRKLACHENAYVCDRVDSAGEYSSACICTLPATWIHHALKAPVRRKSTMSGLHESSYSSPARPNLNTWHHQKL